MISIIKAVKKKVRILPLAFVIFISTRSFAQGAANWELDKMPVDLETDYALSALPPHLRAGATVYLLDPKKGYYLARKGTNGFSVYVNRTEWERVEFVQDTYAALGFDSAGSATLLKVFLEVAGMRASGKYTPSQIKDIVIQRVKDGTYKAPPRSGICYMLSPLLRTHNGEGKIVNMVMPHYMFYAPYVDDADIGGGWIPGGHQPFVANTGPVLDKMHSIFNYIIIAAGETEKAKIVDEDKDLLQRLAAYKSILKVEAGSDAHHH